MKLVSKFALASAMVLGFASSASAQSVSYNTTGFFTGPAGCAGVVCTIGTATLTFTPQTATTVTSPTNITFGEFIWTGAPGTGTFAGVSFTLQVNQTGPSVGSQNISGSVSGNVTPTSSTVSWLNAPANFSIGTVSYTIQSPAIIVAPNSPLGPNTTLQGSVVTASTVPEPSTYALMAAGLAAMGLVARRRRSV